MAAAVVAGEEPESLRRFPETGREELSRFHTLPRRTARSPTRAGPRAGGLPRPNPAATMHDRRGNQCPVSHFQQTRTFPKRHGPS